MNTILVEALWNTALWSVKRDWPDLPVDDIQEEARARLDEIVSRRSLDDSTVFDAMATVRGVIVSAALARRTRDRVTSGR